MARKQVNKVISVRTRPAVTTIHAWEFSHDDLQYIVGAANAEEAKSYLAEKNKEAAGTNPRKLPASLVRFFALTKGKIVPGRKTKNGR